MTIGRPYTRAEKARLIGGCLTFVAVSPFLLGCAGVYGGLVMIRMTVAACVSAARGEFDV